LKIGKVNDDEVGRMGLKKLERGSIGGALLLLPIFDWDPEPLKSS
jgi:hypothetical protein